jgi:uncharacterized membrane protein
MLRRSIESAVFFSSTHSFLMINVFLALVPLGFATGALVWTMSTGARAQQRSDRWAEQWMRDNP